MEFELDLNKLQLLMQTHKDPETKSTRRWPKDANYEGSSQQAKEDLINRRNGQGPEHLKFFLLVFLIFRKNVVNKLGSFVGVQIVEIS